MIPVPEELRIAMMRHGLTPPQMVEIGRFNRFPGADKGKSNKAGWLKPRQDGSAVYGDLSRGLSESWQPFRDKPLTRAEIDTLKREAAKHKAQAEAEQAARQERTADLAHRLWEGAGPAAADHPYLRRKGIRSHGVRQRGDTLTVPLCDPEDGTLWNIQWIGLAGTKRFLKDGRKKGLCQMIDGAEPEGNDVLLVCEGFATAASCREATGFATACTFDASNLLLVALALRARYMEARIVICADDDLWTNHNPGITKAAEAARAVNGLLAVPDFGAHRPNGHTDFNDLAQHAGTDAVKRCIEAATTPDATGADGEAETHKVGPGNEREGQPEDTAPSGPAPWPAALDKEAYHGILGEIVRMIEPQTEADPMAILLQAIVTFGATVGRGPHVRVEGDEHHATLYTVIVGESSKARKGTSAGRVREVFSRSKYRLDSVEGLSSGEGLKYHVRDPREEPQYDRKTRETELVLVDPGVTDKRLLVVESEFAQALRQTARSGNTLSPTVRSAWDTGTMRSLTKNDPIIATGAHICIVGHITITELRAELTQSDMANGFANRFLFALVRRSKLLPFGGDPMDNETLADLGKRIDAAVKHARNLRTVRMTDAARSIWAAIYPELSQGRPGLLGAVTARAEAQTLRVALVYALADCSAVIDQPHLLAALAVTKYAQESAAYVFGDSLGDPVADDLLGALWRAADAGLSRTAIRDHFGKNQRAERINAALNLLSSRGLARKAEVPTGGRPSEVWRATTKTTKTTKGGPA